MIMDTFSDQTLKELKYCLFSPIETKVISQKGTNIKNIAYQKARLKIISSSLMERTFMTNSLILI